MNHPDEAVLCGWTIYHRPSDFPHHYAVRMWVVTDDGQPLMYGFAAICDTLEEAREQIPAGCYCVGREEGDDPVIVESWL